MLFGHQNDTAAQPAPAAPVAPHSSVNPLAVDPATGASLPAMPLQQPSLDIPLEPSVLNQPVAPAPDDTNATATAPVVEPPADYTTEPALAEPPAPPAESSPFEAPAEPEPEPVPPSSDDTAASNDESSPATPSATPDDLLTLKQQALAQLEPLVGQLDQTPEEKFRTTMMLIQSTDNQALIPVAYEAAQQIADEKARAQALLDVINEINYFTQQKPGS